MAGYVFLSNSTKPSEEEQNSRTEVKLTNVSRPCLQTALEMGYDVYFGTNRANPEELQCELPVKMYDSHSYRSITAFKDNKVAYDNLVQIVKKGKVDVIHCNTPVGGFVGRLVGRRYKVHKVIYTAHGFHFFKGAPLFNRTVLKWAEMIMAHWTDAIITMNGGTITNNRGVPAAVGVTASATFIMNGGVITTNNTNTGGHWGSVFFTTGANFEVHGGTIVNNESNIGDGAKIDNIVEEQMQNVITKDYTISPTFIHNSNKYRIISALNNTSAMSIEAGGTCNPISENCNVWLYGNNNASPSQDWGIGLESVVDGKTYYKFYNIGYSNKCLDVDSNGTSDSTNVRSYTCNSSDGQRFYLEPAGNDYYYIKHKTSNKCVDIVGGATTDGTNIQIYTCNNSNAQKWKFVEAN